MSGRGWATLLAAAPGVLAGAADTRDTGVWLLLVLLSCCVALYLACALAASPSPAGSGAVAREVALSSAVAGCLLFAVAWGGRLPLHWEAGAKLPWHLGAAGLAALCAWLLVGGGGQEAG